MNSVKFTPGPWWTDGREVGTVPMMSVKITNNVSGSSLEEAKANAYLIAAAPDLYTAAMLTVKEILAQSAELDDNVFDAVKKLASALEKSKGPV